MQMQFLSLFAGIGGFDLGLERAGMQCVGQVEIEPYCQAVLEHHWPHVKRVGDIRDVTADSFSAVGLVCGGFPCQPFSLAGKRAGKADDRYLWPEMLRVVEAYGPTWVLGENVPGIIGVELDKVLADLESLGYEVQPFVVPACAVDAPHRRDRVWIVAHSMRDRCEANSGRGPLSDINRVSQAHATGREEQQPRVVGADLVAHASSIGSRSRLRQAGQEQDGDVLANGGQTMADSAGRGFGADGRALRQGGHADERGASLPNTGCAVQEERDGTEGERALATVGSGRRWEPEPNVGRLASRIPNRVAQLRALGNSVVPQVVEEIGRAILKAEEAAAGECGGANSSQHG